MKAYRKRSFTLVELLVSIGLLSLMMIFMLRFFTGSQKLWGSGDGAAALRQSAHGALELMGDLVTTVQFSLGEKTVSGKLEHDATMDAIFSVNNRKTGDYGDAHEMFFACKTASELPKKTNDIRFIGLRLGDPASEYARGKLFMLIYCDKRKEDRFYSLFPRYDSHYDGNKTHGNRDKALYKDDESLKNWLVPPAKEEDENEYAQILAENVVAFRIDAFDRSGGIITPGEDIKEPPYMLKITLTLLGKEDFATFVTLSGAARTDFLNQKAGTFTRSVFIGDRWQLAKARFSE